MGEWIFIIVAIIIVFFTLRYLRRFRITKTEIVLEIISLVGLTTWIIIFLINNFSYRQLSMTCLFIYIGLFSFYKRYQKYKRNNPTLNS